MTLSPYSARMASQVCRTMTEMVLWASLKPNIRLLSSGQETKCDGKSASRVDGLPVPSVIFLNSGPNPLQDLSEYGRVYPD